MGAGFLAGALPAGTSPARTGSVTEENTIGMRLPVRITAGEVGVAMVWIKSTLACTSSRAMASARTMSPRHRGAGR